MTIEFWQLSTDGCSITTRAHRFDTDLPREPLRIPFRLMFHDITPPPDLPVDGVCELDLARLRKKILEAIKFQENS